MPDKCTECRTGPHNEAHLSECPSKPHKPGPGAPVVLPHGGGQVSGARRGQGGGQRQGGPRVAVATTTTTTKLPMHAAIILLPRIYMHEGKEEKKGKKSC